MPVNKDLEKRVGDIINTFEMLKNRYGNNIDEKTYASAASRALSALVKVN